MEEKKVILVGDAGVGKTTFVKRLMDQNFDPKYIATLGVEVYPIIDRERNITYNIWDCAGQEKFAGLSDGYHICSDIGIIMYSADSKITYKSVNSWKTRIQRINPNIPIYVLCNKIDVKNQKVTQDNLISCKNDVHIEQVFNMLAGEDYTSLSGNIMYNRPSKATCVSSDHIKTTLCQYATLHFDSVDFLELLNLIVEDNMSSILKMVNIKLYLEINDYSEEMFEQFNFRCTEVNDGVYINSDLYTWIKFIQDDTMDICTDVHRTIKRVFPELEVLMSIE